MKTVKDYMNVAQQFHYIPDREKFHALIKAHGIEFAMLKFIFVRHLEHYLADSDDCSCCEFSRRAKVWLMCDKHGKRATHICDSLQLDEATQEFDAEMRERIAAVRNIHDYDEFLIWVKENRYDYMFYNALCSQNAFYKCSVDESAAQKALCNLAKDELTETKALINANSECLAKLQSSIAEVQDKLNKQRDHVQQINDFLNNPI